MAIKFTRSTSFFTVDLQESLETLLQKALRRRAKYVIVNARRGPEVSFYVWERRTFANALQQVQQDAKELVPADAGRITLRQLLVNKLDQLVELETTAGSLDLISKEIEMFIKKGNPVVHLQENEPRAILLPTKSAFPKVSTRMSLDFGRLSHLLLRDYVELQEMDRARCADPCPPNVGEGWQFDTFDMVYDVPPTEGAAPQEAAGGGGPPEGNGGRGGEGPGGSDSGGNPPPGEPPAYPNLKVSDEHPIQDTTINIEVSIDFEKPKHTTGVVTLPSDDREYTLDVHLLVEKESRWERLKFKRPEGTTQPAIFKGVTVPMIPVIQRHAEERLACDIYVNFYLLQPYEKADGTPVRNARWCGEAVRRIEILAREELSPTKIEPPKQVEWRKYLHVSPTSPPPDFLVRIKKLRDREFQWTVLSPHRDFTGLPADELNSTLSASPYAFMQDHFEKFAGKPLDEAKIRKLDGLCDVIYESTPAGFRKAYWDLYLGTGQDPQRRAALESIQFVSDEPFIPWELMRLSDDERAPNVAPEILAVRHAVGRWVALDSVELRQALRVKEIAVFDRLQLGRVGYEEAEVGH